MISFVQVCLFIAAIHNFYVVHCSIHDADADTDADADDDDDYDHDHDDVAILFWVFWKLFYWASTKKNLFYTYSITEFKKLTRNVR